jgi:hypothetical protein
MKSRRSITISSQSLMATASAERGWPSSRAISPKIWPGLMMLSTASWPSLVGTLIFTEPHSTAISPVPGSPLAKMVAPRRTERRVM